MDFTDEEPSRWWLLNTESHPDTTTCTGCGQPLDRTKAIPVTAEGGLCENCVHGHIEGHPVTATYLKWLDEGDPRWWSPYLCNCEGCGVEELC